MDQVFVSFPKYPEVQYSLNKILSACNKPGRSLELVRKELNYFIDAVDTPSHISFCIEMAIFKRASEEQLETLNNNFDYLNRIITNIPDRFFKTGKFIVLEGTDHSGKSTVLADINLKYPELYETREPGGTILAEKIRDLILEKDDPYDPMHPKVELLLYFASRVQHINALIVPARQAGIDIFSSRFYDSSYGYQQDARGIDNFWIDSLVLYACEDEELAVPSLVISLYMGDKAMANVEEKLKKRAEESGVAVDRLESEGQSFLSITNEYFKRLDSVYSKLSKDDTRYDLFKSIIDMMNSDRKHTRENGMLIESIYDYDTTHVETFRPTIDEMLNDVTSAIEKHLYPGADM